MIEALEKYDEILEKVAAKIKQQCGFKDSTFVVILILLLINSSTWTLDKSYLAKIYQAIDIIEKDEELKKLFQQKVLTGE